MVLSRHQPQASASTVNAASGRDEFGATAIRQRIQGTVRTGTADNGHQVTFQALGTLCRFTLAGPASAAKAFTETALLWMAAFEAKYSRFWPQSLITRINQAAGRDWVEIDPEAERLLALCAELHFVSRGVLDPTLLPLLQLWNWKASPVVVPTEDQIRQTLNLVGWRKVQRAPGKVFLPTAGMGIDLGGVGKEYAVDQITLLTRQFGLTGALIDFGADIRVTGIPPDGRPGWHIGLEDPQHLGRAWTGLAVREAAVATSGTYHRGFEIGGVRYGHILDPRTGKPTANGVRAVSVLAPSCTQAGFLSTTALVLGPAEGLRLIDSTPGAAGAILTETQCLQSRHFHEHVVS